jgi:hypothetical protein
LDGAVGDAGAGADEHDGDGVAFVDDDDGVLVAVDVAAFDVDAEYPVGDAVQVVRVGSGAPRRRRRRGFRCLRRSGRSAPPTHQRDGLALGSSCLSSTAAARS